ncbi:MAG: MATE family efflux transporter [Pelomonas sp.]|nr:MATE family efflux transporter [Roseateles sp.]
MSATRPRLFPLAWPLFLEMLLGIGVGLVGTTLAARLSDANGGAFAMANTLAGTLFVFVRIIGAGIGVVVTQNLGAGRRAQADAVARAAVGASTWIGGTTALVAVLFAHPLLALLNAPPAVLALAAPLLRALAPALLLDVWNASMASVMRSHLRTRDTLAVIVVMQICTLSLALPLMPRLGLPGYALALAISRGVGLALHLWLWRARLGLRMARHDWWRLPRATLAPVLHIGVPGAAENIAYRLAFMVSVAAVGTLGTRAVATHAYTQQLMFIVLLFGLATGFSVEIIVGHLVGAGELHAAHRLVRRALGVGLVASVIIAGSFALASPWLLRCFSDDASIIAMGRTLMCMTVLLEPGRTFNLVVINALRAAGDARFPVMAGAASMLIVLAGGSWLLGVHFGLGLPGIWIAYASDEWIRGLIMWRRWARHGWVPHARATHRRVRRAAQVS